MLSVYFERQLWPIVNDSMIVQHVAAEQYVLLAFFENYSDLDRLQIVDGDSHKKYGTRHNHTMEVLALLQPHLNQIQS